MLMIQGNMLSRLLVAAALDDHAEGSAVTAFDRHIAHCVWFTQSPEFGFSQQRGHDDTFAWSIRGLDLARPRDTHAPHACTQLHAVWSAALPAIHVTA